MRVGELEIDLARRSVTSNGHEVHLTPIEYDLLRHLAQNADRVLTHRQLLTRVWGAEYAEDTHTLRVQVREYGVMLDQVVLSPTTYLNTAASCPNMCAGAPGPVSNDHTIVPKS